jgi:adenine specific DNA methylase Mod
MKTETKTIDRVIEHFGTAYKAAIAIGVKHQQMYDWKKKGFIPFKRGMQIEQLTDGAIKATEIWNDAGRSV